MLLNEDVVYTQNLMECVRLLLLHMNFQGYFYMHQPFLLYIQDLHKYQMVLYNIFNID